MKKAGIILIGCIGWLFDLVDAKEMLVKDEAPTYDMEIPLFVGASQTGYHVQPFVDDANNVHYDKLTMSTRNLEIIQLNEIFIDFILENNKKVTFTLNVQDGFKHYYNSATISYFFLLECFDKDLKHLFKSPIKQTVLRNEEDSIVHKIFIYDTHDPDYFTKLKPSKKELK